MATSLLEHFKSENEREFFARLQSMDQVVCLYEQPSLQQQALDVLPVSELKQKAKEASEKSRENGQDGADERDCLLIEVNKFFGSFFHWQDKPKCSNCGTKTENIGPVPPTAEERKWLVGRVEGYKCPKCGKDERYPRYNHPGKLLETRYGRCGEHANCQALLLRSMGFEIRHITDWTDHVWLEVYSNAQQRWMKCDDNVLEYESSWGKKLTYIIAVSNEEVVDVTWRYSAKHNEVMQRRLLVSEEWLAKTLALFNAQKQRKVSPERRQTLMERSARELAEFFSGYEGKLLGTVAWRRLIGKPESNHKPYTFTPTDDEINSKRIRVQYCCASDKYFRGSKMEAFLEGWTSGAAAVNSVFRKYEYDWTKVLDYLLSHGLEEADLATLQKGNAYLARLRGSPSGLVSWKMDFTASGLVIDTITIVTRCVTMETGKVDWKLQGDDDIVQDLTFSSDHKAQTTSSLNGCKTLKLTASLSGGNGDLAWQHAQLCSQPIDSEDDCSLDITVLLKDSVA